MKKQLLEDIDDSQSGAPALPARSNHIAPAPHPRGRAWRTRPVSVTPFVWRPAPPPPPAPPPIPEPGIAAFSSREPDWASPIPLEAPPWTERWGRKALGWSGALVAVAIAAGATLWMRQETELASTLAIVADHTPPPAAPEAPPPLKLLPPEPDPVEIAAPVDDAPLVEDTLRELPDIEAAPAPVPPPRKIVKRVAAAPLRKPAPKAVAVRKPVPTPAADPLAETLRLCRAAGYHASACMKRGCEATRFGLACRG